MRAQAVPNNKLLILLSVSRLAQPWIDKDSDDPDSETDQLDLVDNRKLSNYQGIEGHAPRV
jgi:hypothetical protein